MVGTAAVYAKDAFDNHVIGKEETISGELQFAAPIEGVDTVLSNGTRITAPSDIMVWLEVCQKAQSIDPISEKKINTQDCSVEEGYADEDDLMGKNIGDYVELDADRFNRQPEIIIHRPN